MRRTLLAALAGTAAWLAYVARQGAGPFSLDALFLFAPLVLVPLALDGLRDDSGTPLRWARALQPVGAVGAALAFLASAGIGAAALALPWAAFTVLLAFHGARRFLRRGAGPPEELLVDIGLVYLPVGAAWLLASRFGMQPLGFGEPIVLLTAIHFHYAAFAAPLFGGLVGRLVLPAGRGVNAAYVIAATGLAAGPALLAAGITLSHTLEVMAAFILATSVVLMAALALVGSAARQERGLGWARAALAVAALATLVSMGAAMAWALGLVMGQAWLDITLMARVHGAVNAFVFLPLGLLGAGALARAPRGPRDDLPVSRLMSDGHTGADFFERTGALDQGPRAPTGLADDLDAYRKDGFEPARVAPAIRAFYENTAAHDLVVFPTWRRGFLWGGRLYHLYAERAGQMRLPLVATADGAPIHSRILPVRDAVDGRTNVRAWVRTYADTGAPVYVAAYSTHARDGETYMNIAFPFPGWNLTSVLRIEPFGDDGVLLTTHATRATWGDQGVYAVTKQGRWRLPMNESIRVWTRGLSGAPFDSEAPVMARHEIAVFGIPFLRLDYRIAARPGTQRED